MRISRCLFWLLPLLTIICACQSSREEASGDGQTRTKVRQVAGFRGVVVETMDASNYTYLHLDDGREKRWVAAPRCSVTVGDTLVIPPGDRMTKFKSSSLGRTFDVIYFVSHVVSPSQVARMAGSGQGAGVDPGEFDYSGLTRPSGGVTVAELFAAKKKLVGKSVLVRAKVVKANYEIMGKTWLHIRDGTGDEGRNDIRVSTSVKPRVGETVLVKGTLVLDKDLGYGYQFPVLIEDAQVTTEK